MRALTALACVIATAAPAAAQQPSSWVYRQQYDTSGSWQAGAGRQPQVPWVYRQQSANSAANTVPWQYRQNADAGQGARADQRRVWEARDGSGGYQQVGPGVWQESGPGGQYLFQEALRTPRRVELYDGDRGIGVRLTDRQMFLGRDGWQLFEAGPVGGWR